MKLITDSVKPGDWITIQGGAPEEADLSPQYISLNNRPYPAYVDQGNLIVRCPDLGDRATVEVHVRGYYIGKIQIPR